MKYVLTIAMSLVGATAFAGGYECTMDAAPEARLQILPKAEKAVVKFIDGDEELGEILCDILPAASTMMSVLCQEEVDGEVVRTTNIAFPTTTSPSKGTVQVTAFLPDGNTVSREPDPVTCKALD